MTVRSTGLSGATRPASQFATPAAALCKIWHTRTTRQPWASQKGGGTPAALARILQGPSFFPTAQATHLTESTCWSWATTERCAGATARARRFGILCKVQDRPRLAPRAAAQAGRFGPGGRSLHANPGTNGEMPSGGRRIWKIRAPLGKARPKTGHAAAAVPGAYRLLPIVRRWLRSCGRACPLRPAGAGQGRPAPLRDVAERDGLKA